MITEEEKFQGKTLSISHTKIAISTIKEKFSEQQLRRFEESCFGHLLLIEDLKWTSPIVHGLLLRKADPKTVSQVNGIKFIVGNKVIQFTAQQFCVVIGLRFGNLPFIPIATNENCSLKRKYFGNDKTVNLSELEKAFLDCADADDVLKLGFVYFAVFVLLGSEKHIWAYEVFPTLVALHLVVHEDNAYIPRILHWKSNTSERFSELMSQVFENREVDVQLLRPTVIDKQQPYWTWEEKDDDIEETATLPSSSKDKLASTELRTLKRDFQRTKDELAKVSSSNRALRNSVHELEEMIRKESLKLEREFAENKKCVEDFCNTLASM
ncbi:hypothetical protein L3X38_018631 [Prunus dulcis]|uniref:DUF1985 domain-containing protein n=1 Tax=Prunus dulcis TaxID=3755 RepID=A0AAD4W9L6_PRUDU|nr:hypothetical protein L3X38_018631 [Prunus dulcis]